MVRLIQTSLHHFLCNHQGQIGRVGANILNRLATLMIDFTRRVALNPLGFGRHPLLIFFHEPLRPFLGGGENCFRILRRGIQLGLVLLEFPFCL